MRNKEWEGAENDYNKLLEINPKHGHAYYNRSLIKLHFGDQRGGCNDLYKAWECGYNISLETIKHNCGPYLNELN